MTNPNGYTHQPHCRDIETLFESARPNHILHARGEAVFLCDNIDDIDNTGGYNDHVYLVDVEDNSVEKSDLSWYTKAREQLEDGDIEAAKQSAKHYWKGTTLEGVFEYRTDMATIIDKIEAN